MYVGRKTHLFPWKYGCKNLTHH